MRAIPGSALTLMLLLILPTVAPGHCDTMNGPVVLAARQALDRGDVNLVLLWVQPGDEAEVTAAFEQARSVRQLGPAAATLADLYFFETVVRLHRAGEGVAYTGLKPAGTAVEPGIAEADRALETHSVEPVVRSLTRALERGLRDRFNELEARREHAGHTLAAGRTYVKSYVEFIHYVERLHQSILTSPGHTAEPPGEHPH